MSRYKFGFEREYFCRRSDGEITLVPSHAPHDECGWLFEVRSRPSHDVLEAIHLLNVEDVRLSRILKNCSRVTPEGTFTWEPVLAPVMPISRKLRDLARRRFKKDLVTERNLYGHTCHRNRMTEGIAAFHVNITAPLTHTKNGVTVPFNSMWDFVPFIKKMDEAFADEIKAAKRRPGFYDVHHDGRVEYRSLPNDICVEKLERVLKDILLGRHY